MTTNYNRSPLRSLYNAQGAQAANSRRLGAQQRQRQLGGLSQVRQRSAMDTGMTDKEETAAKRLAAKKGLNYGYSQYAQPEAFDTAGYDEVASTIDDAGGAEAVNPNAGSGGGGENSSADDGGSYLGAVTGGLAGYGAGTANSRTDPAMVSGEDGFGKYDTFGWGGGYKDSMGNTYYDRRADLGGTIGGAWLGWEGFAPLSSAAVRWSHPYMQDMTRDVINLGGSLGGAGGAMLLDPIGTMASGKYSQRDIAESGLEAAASGGLSLLGHSDPVKKLNDKIKDVFGW